MVIIESVVIFFAMQTVSALVLPSQENTYLLAIEEKCSNIKNKTDFSNQADVFTNCQYSSNISLFISEPLSYTNRWNVVCLLYYATFVSACSNLDSSELIPNISKLTLDNVCNKTEWLNRNKEMSEFSLTAIIKNQSDCEFLCRDQGPSKVYSVCAKAFYFANKGQLQNKQEGSSLNDNVDHKNNETKEAFTNHTVESKIRKKENIDLPAVQVEKIRLTKNQTLDTSEPQRSVPLPKGNISMESPEINLNKSIKSEVPSSILPKASEADLHKGDTTLLQPSTENFSLGVIQDSDPALDAMENEELEEAEKNNSGTQQAGIILTDKKNLNGENEGHEQVNQIHNKVEQQETFEFEKVADSEIEMDGSSYFFSYFMIVCVIFIVSYVGYHNKQKIVAVLIEGRSNKRQQRGRRPNSANYHKLDTNLEEAISSTVHKNANSVIY